MWRNRRKRSMWPPSAAVRHASIAPITRHSTRPSDRHGRRWVAMPAQNIRDLDGGPLDAGSGRIFPASLRGSSGGVSSSDSRSSGLWVAPIMPVATRV